jgi:phospholipid/cholesterol/gamma-HCH transport system permease protein
VSDSPESAGSAFWFRGPAAVGAGLRAALDRVGRGFVYVGGITRLLGTVIQRTWYAVRGRGTRIHASSLTAQMVRVGVRAIPLTILVQIFIGIILALNMAPTLQAYGQIQRTADIIAIAIFRELGPLITAVLLSGFAGASIAAELGAMVEGEEIKALRAHALDPLRFLVIPRIVATAVMMLGRTVLADVMGIIGGLLVSVTTLNLTVAGYLTSTQLALTLHDYFTGLFKGGVFGGIIAMIACYEGLNTSGGAEGVGRATTTTVVKSIVSLIGADALFTAIFYAVGW